MPFFMNFFSESPVISTSESGNSSYKKGLVSNLQTLTAHLYNNCAVRSGGSRLVRG